MKQSEKAFNNRAMFANELTPNLNNNENELIIFDFKKNDIVFSAGIKTILACYKIAEIEKFMHEQPDEWWQKIKYAYGVDYSEIKSYKNYINKGFCKDCEEVLSFKLVGNDNQEYYLPLKIVQECLDIALEKEYLPFRQRS